MDNNKRPFYAVKRQKGTTSSTSSLFIHNDDTDKNNHIYQRHHTTTLSKRGIFVLTCLIVITSLFLIGRYINASPSHLSYSDTSTSTSAATRQQLLDQPSYTTPIQCRVQLCNPSQRCSTWYPAFDRIHRNNDTTTDINAPVSYDWSDLVQQGVYRDLATIKADSGCVVSLQVEDETAGLAHNKSHWIPIPSGEEVDCLEQKQCRNVIAMTINDDLTALLSQLEAIMLDEPNQMDEEKIVTRMVNSTSESLITLVSQFSVNRLDVFSNVIEAWSGPISVAIYLTERNDIHILKDFFINPMNAELYGRVSITVVKPSYNNDERLRYPINHLRNLAIMASSTPYVFVMDADFIPSTTLYTTAQTLLTKTINSSSSSSSSSAIATNRRAIVIPCFAIHEEYSRLPLPTTMTEVASLVDQGIAYITDPGAGHGPTLGKEMALSLSKGSSADLYEVCYESQWEPYYIIPRDAPLYDVRFKNQGGDKQSHALQLNAERYRFLVLQREFMIHKDHAKMVWPGGGFPKAQKDRQLWNYFGGFMREMEMLYGYNVRWPHGCSALAIGWQEQRRNTLGMALGAV
ncbi:glycosyl-transferase for dystroglycan-domain-containing protein [Halteromyces radiatus]|uniref:glycosyl-transferase for dystroglycan-domain-containing protein n=1 Tax=Halteromyces radiatus TaxID=101107 RepID=UPI00221FDC6C|nr:glycosyl-transferase for dystroglycan-domain-containing protein [Halteromyces radiatus]KAI8085147.1 glycosyl-transferase for dystroglycan-domain-containing protein [Halteromyces radiatus]